MAVTLATITGTIKQPSTGTGVRCRITAVPQTRSTGISTTDGLLYGVVKVDTDATGALVDPFKVPVVADIVWSFYAEPLDAGDRGGPGNASLKRWNFYNGPITASTTLQALADTDPLAFVADFPPSLVAQAVQAKLDAQAAATAAQAVGTIADTQIAGRINTPGSATATALSNSFVPSFPDETTLIYAGSDLTSVTENGITTTFSYTGTGSSRRIDTDSRVVGGATITRQWSYDSSGKLTGIEAI